MKRILRSAVSLLLCAAVALGGTACGRSKLPTTITIWTYYNGDQLEILQPAGGAVQLHRGQREEHPGRKLQSGQRERPGDQRAGRRRGQGGAEKLPNIVSSYADTAFTLDQMGLAVDLSPYLTEKEKSAYIAGFLEEGDLMNNGDSRSFP